MENLFMLFCSLAYQISTTFSHDIIDFQLHFESLEIETTATIAEKQGISEWNVVHNTNLSVLLNDSDFENTTKINSIITNNQQTNHIINNDAFTINLLSITECKNLIQISERYGYGIQAGATRMRLSINDPLLARKLYLRVKKFLPSNFSDSDGILYHIYGFNERIRFTKYTKGDQFSMHIDHQRENLENNQISFYTINIYLNSGDNQAFTGGRTLFYGLNNEVTSFVVPKSGMALIFNHGTQTILHSGEQIENGIKYLMRTDVMYTIVDNMSDSLNSKREL